MNILLLLVPISIVLLGIAIWAFAWAVRRGQFDDLDTPALDILADDTRPRPAASGTPRPASGAAGVEAASAPAPAAGDPHASGTPDDAD